jgi:hypothetical protein
MDIREFIELVFPGIRLNKWQLMMIEKAKEKTDARSQD